MNDVVVGATCILDRSKILGWEGSRLAKMTDDEEKLGTDQVLADAMRSISLSIALVYYVVVATSD